MLCVIVLHFLKTVEYRMKEAVTAEGSMCPTPDVAFLHWEPRLLARPGAAAAWVQCSSFCLQPGSCSELSGAHPAVLLGWASPQPTQQGCRPRGQHQSPATMRWSTSLTMVPASWGQGGDEPEDETGASDTEPGGRHQVIHQAYKKIVRLLISVCSPDSYTRMISEGYWALHK